MTETGIRDAPPTRKGQETRRRIVSAAATLMHGNGVEHTTLDDVIAAAQVGKSQIYHYFRDKATLVEAVIDYQADDVLRAGGTQAMPLESWGDWDAWCDAVVTSFAATGCVGGCPVGSLAGELADQDENARERLAAVFERWARGFERGLRAMLVNGLLKADADPRTLSIGVLASLEGGLLLSQTAKSPEPLRIALDAAIARLRGECAEVVEVAEAAEGDASAASPARPARPARPPATRTPASPAGDEQVLHE